MAYSDEVEFIETSVFTKTVTELLSDEELGSFQSMLAVNPDAGSIIRGSGGIRKIRWSRGNPGQTRRVESDLLLVYR